MVPFLPLTLIVAPPGCPPIFTTSASFRSTFVPEWLTVIFLSLLEKSTVASGATLDLLAVSLLVVMFQPLLAVSFTSFNCSSVAARPCVANPDTVKVLLVNPVKVPVVPLSTTLLAAFFNVMLFASIVLLLAPAVITVLVDVLTLLLLEASFISTFPSVNLVVPTVKLPALVKFTSFASFNCKVSEPLATTPILPSVNVPLAPPVTLS